MSETVSALAGEMVTALEAAASEAVGSTVSLVSVTLDSLGEPAGSEPRFETAIDRKTRTLVFLNGKAHFGHDAAMTATAVFAIKS